MGSYRTGLLDLCGYARAVFAHQPTRLFLHGFYVCEGTLELWVFDRSGLYNSEAFDIAQDPDRFLTVLIGYMLMDDAELGVSGLIKEDSHGIYVQCGDDDKAGRERLYLGEPTIFERVNKNIVSDGLTCYRARLQDSDRYEYVVKMKWSTASEKSEIEILQLVKEKRVAGVVQLFSHQAVCSTDALHHGLQIGAPRDLRQDAAISGRNNIGFALENTVEVHDAGGPTNKLLNCIVVSPLGESFHRFRTVLGLLRSMHDATKAHRSLYQVAEVLHQDICPGR